MSSELISALSDLAAERGIDQLAVLERLEQDLARSYKGILDLDWDAQVTIDRESGRIFVYEMVGIGEEDPETGEYEDYEPRDVTPENVSRIAAQNAKRVINEIVHDFDTLPCVNFGSKPRVGVVGEILVKFHPTANNQIVQIIEEEGCEANVPGLVDFFLFGMLNPAFRHQELTPNLKKYVGAKGVVAFFEKLRDPVRKALAASERFEPIMHIEDIAQGASDIIDLGNTMGEGWLLTGEMVELVKEGTPNIVCCQPFACLPNHVVGKAVIKEMRRQYPQSNIVAVDYDPGASEVNQLNRIKLMIAVAFNNQKEQAEEQAAQVMDRVEEDAARA